MKSILWICVHSSLRVISQRTEILFINIDLTPDISKKTTFYIQVHNSLKIESLCF